MSTTPRQPECHWFDDDGRIPNSRLPVLLYRAVVSGAGAEAAAGQFEAAFRRHDWPPDWRDGVYDYHHYHSTAHEVLGIAGGSARLMLGGASGEVLEVAAGDVLVLPAGTGHCAVSHDADFLVVGAYPKGQRWDVMRGDAEDRPAALQRIAQVPTPVDDPIGGALLRLWGAR